MDPEILKQMEADFVARMKSLDEQSASTFKEGIDRLAAAARDYSTKVKERLDNPIQIDPDHGRPDDTAAEPAGPTGDSPGSPAGP